MTYVKLTRPYEGKDAGEIIEVDDHSATAFVDGGRGEITSEAPSTGELKGKLPDDFPGHAALEAAGITTYAQLRKAGDVTEIMGIGEVTAEKIAEVLAE